VYTTVWQYFVFKQWNQFRAAQCDWVSNKHASAVTCASCRLQFSFSFVLLVEILAFISFSFFDHCNSSYFNFRNENCAETNPARRRVTSLMCPTALPLSETATVLEPIVICSLTPAVAYNYSVYFAPQSGLMLLRVRLQSALRRPLWHYRYR